jgi:thioredoxin-related protein
LPVPEDHFVMRLMQKLVTILIASLALAGPAAAAELVMFRSAGCPYCAAWDKAIGPVYPKTDIGKRLPLRPVDLERSRDGKVVLVSPIRFTPTFVLVDSGREMGRIEGYPGEDFFWGLLERLLLQHRL